MKSLMIGLIVLYQKTISPYLGNHCRFFPTCSEYSKAAFERKGFFRGLYLTLNRMLRCNPFGQGGFDVIES